MAESVLGKINYLTEEQYQNAKANGQINENEIYMTPDDAMIYDRPVVLYDNPNGTTTSFELSDNPKNYTKLDIIVGYQEYHATNTVYPNTARWEQVMLAFDWHDGTSGFGRFGAFYQVDGKKFIIYSGFRFYKYSGQNPANDNTNSCSVFKVIGYKLKKQADPDGNNTYDNTEYSTGERIVGTWVNGKPLYRKVFTTITVSGNSSSTTAHGISNLDTVARYTAHSYYNGVFRPVTYAANSTYTLCEIDKTNIYIYNTSANPYTITVIMEYTKTTD